MSTSNHDLPGVDAVQPVDPDLAEQAVPGHGVPSQDPAASAQVGLLPEEAEREAKSAFVGGGAVAQAASNALRTAMACVDTTASSQAPPQNPKASATRASRRRCRLTSTARARW